MGYDLHITRKEFWANETGPEIGLDDWLRHAQGDPDIRPDPDNPGQDNWLVALADDDWPLWWYRTGELYTKNPPDAMIRKLVAIAAVLDARVLGDDNEIYGVDAAGAVRVVPR